MKLIHNNPYRIAGILSNSSEKELQKQKSKITKYVNIGKQVDSEYDFPFFNKLDRSENSILKAFSSLEQNQDKVGHSLFWFVKTNSVDETAINYLINGDKDKAIEIWGKVTEGKEISSKNYSCFNNIGTLKLLGEAKEEIMEGIAAKVKLIESPWFVDFVHTVADQTYSIDNQKQTEAFVDDLVEQFESKYSSTHTLELFSICNGTTIKYLTKKITEEPLYKIETQIENTKNKRNIDKSSAYEFGLNLFVNCKEDLATLKSLLGIDDLRYKMAADNLAKEVMRCAIEYFQELKETRDPSREGIKLLKYAESIAIGTQTKDRIKENLEGMQEWAKTAPVKDDLNYISNKLRNFQNVRHSIENADLFISNCKARLQNIKGILGLNDEFYIAISSAVVSNALGMIIDVVNQARSGLEYDRAKLLLLPTIVSGAVSTINSMDSLDMNSQTRERFLENRATIISINNQLESLRGHIRSSSSSSTSSGSSGCYIATMAYGGYDHPQVMKLRKFRDEFLSKSDLGRSFIRNYYIYSPLLVEQLKDKPKTNDIIRTLLDQLIKIIRK